MRWRIRRIINGCAAQQLVARRDVIAPEFISYGPIRCSLPPTRWRSQAAVELKRYPQIQIVILMSGMRYNK